MRPLLRSRIDEKTASVGIIGLGSVGPPLARAFVAGGFAVLGFDVDPGKVSSGCSMRPYRRLGPRSDRPCLRRGGQTRGAA